MTPPRSEGYVRMPDAEFEAILTRAAEEGAKRALADAGLDSDEVAQSVLAKTQSAILPLVRYLDTLRWVFIAVALGGIAVTIYARLDDWRRGPP